MNREIRRTTVGFDGRFSIQETQYDSWGRVAAIARPYFVGEPVRWTRPQYDLLGRVTQTTAPDGGVTFAEYDGLTTLVADPLDRTTQQEKNGLGQVVTTTDALQATLRFVHDPFGNLSETVNPHGNRVMIGYDLRGRKISMSDPDMGNWTYRYNVLGELVQQTDAKGQVTTLVYDALGRMTQRNEPGMTSTWQWDVAAMGIGKLAQFSTNNGHSRSHGYDALGRLIIVETIIDSSVFTLTTQYDSFSRVLKTIYPTGFALHNFYTSNGYLAEVRDATTQKPFWQAKSVDAAGRVLEEVLGNGLTTRRTHDAVGRTTGIRTTTTAGAAIQNLAVRYDLAGNVLFRDDLVTRRTHTFTYDEVNRLVSDLDNNGSLLSLRYDAIGNITYKSDVGSYAYGVKPHAVTQITGTLNAALVYDANGNQTQGLGNRTVSYTSWNMPAKITRGTASLTYAYDASHERFRQIGPEGTTIYLNPRVDLGAHFEQTTFPGGSKESRHHIYAGAQVIGELVLTSTGVKTTRYFHSDQLGSIDVVTNDLGNVVARYEYQPFGSRTVIQGDANSTKHGFTGHEHLTNVGLIHMNGRVYDPVIARFLSADPTIQFPGNLQSYNRYSYVMNNPLAFTDPSGYGLFSSIGKFFSKAWNNPIVRIAATIAVAYFTEYYNFGTLAAPSYGIAGASSVGFAGEGAAFINSVSAGFTAGFVGSGGNLNIALTGAAMGGIGFGLSGSGIFGQMIGGGINGYAQTGKIEGFARGFVAGAIPLNLGFESAYMDKWYGNVGISLLRDGIRGGIVGGKDGIVKGIGFGQINNALGHLVGFATSGGNSPIFKDGAFFYEGSFWARNEAITFGNVISGHPGLSQYPGEFVYKHERGHIPQGSLLGALYAPAHGLSLTVAKVFTGDHHSRANLLENDMNYMPHDRGSSFSFLDRLYGTRYR